MPPPVDRSTYTVADAGWAIVDSRSGKIVGKRETEAAAYAATRGTGERYLIGRYTILKDAPAPLVLTAKRRRLRAGFRPSRSMLSMVMLRQNALCYYCGSRLWFDSREAKTMPTVDHRLPLHLGGEPYGDNIVAACHECNQMKGPLTEEEFLELRDNPLVLREAVRQACIAAQASAEAGERPIVRRRPEVWAARQKLYESLRPYVEAAKNGNVP